MTQGDIITFPNDPTTTKSVSVAGAFSNWEPLSMNFNAATNQWEFDLYGYLISLKSKEENIDKSYMYKFILNETTWCCNILKPIVKDDSGNDNNVIQISDSSSESANASSIGSQSPESLSKPAGYELSPLSSVHSIDEGADTVAKQGAPKEGDGEEEEEEGEDDDNVDSIDDVAIADEVNGFFGLIYWLWELILLRVFGKDLSKPSTTEEVGQDD